MSQANVELTWLILQAWQRDDLSSWLGRMDPSIEHHTVLERLVEGSQSLYRGQAGMLRFWDVYRTELEDFELEAEDIRDVGDDRVVLLGRFRWRGPASGIETESQLSMVITFRDGKVIRSVDYFGHDEGLRAVGLAD
jgi:ketosteroid isomerase-like protein